MVKILCVSDIVDPLVYSSNLKKRYGDVDFIVSSGDLQLNYYGFIVSLLNKPLYFIFGNHHLTHLEDFSKKCKNFDHFKDADDLTKNYFGSTYIGEGVVRDKNTGLLLAGFGGSLCYNKGEHQYSE
ncbi:MAG: metallophosphoesterase, partial [Spirochaetales bacterium]|nr:metallophosphoesterase [Spirochaetales bacterium]